MHLYADDAQLPNGMPAVDAVCFDLDGTLCLPERSDREFLRAVFEEVGTDPLFTPADLRAIDAEDLGPAEDVTEFYTNLYRATLHEVDAPASPDDPIVEELGTAAGDLYDPAAVRFREGAADALEYARRRYEVGLITNGTRETQQTKLEALGVADAFDAILVCDPDRGIPAKPAPEPFELALNRLGTTAETTVHVGDTLGEDVAGAHEAGLRSVWVPTNRPHEEHPADPEPAPTHRIRSMADLPEIL